MEKEKHRKRHFRDPKFGRFLEQYTPQTLPNLERLCRSNLSYNRPFYSCVLSALAFQ